MSEKEKVFYGDIVKVGRVYWLGSSLVVVYHGPWYYVGDKVAEILKSMRMEWKANNYRQYCHEFERNSSRWVVYLDVIEPAGSAVEPKETILKIYMQRVEPSALRFSVLYHPKTVTLDSVNLEDLLKSLLYWLPHIAEDVDLSTPSLGITRLPHPARARGRGSVFQLPLSGSPAPAERERPARGPHPLSTPSLGITDIWMSRRRS